MELCKICGKGVKMGWGRRCNVSGRDENVYFCSEKCENRWLKKEYGIIIEEC